MRPVSAEAAVREGNEFEFGRKRGAASIWNAGKADGRRGDPCGGRVAGKAGFAFIGGGEIGSEGLSTIHSPWRRTPRRNSRPSLRQFLAMAANCSRCHLTQTLEPI